MKIGIFAGTFDPIHDGHIAFAQAAIREAKLDKVVLVAEKEPYRKKPHAAWDHRQAMIERATKDLEQVDHDYHFAAQLAHKHTMKDMLEVARGHYGNEHEFWFLVGSDLFEHMHQWHDLIEAADYGGFVVALRQDHSSQWLQTQAASYNLKAIRVTNPYPALGSSSIRQTIARGQQPEGVASSTNSYIADHNLYQSPHQPHQSVTR